MHKVLMIALTLCASSATPAQVGGSYHPLKGKRLSSFFRSKGESEKGHYVSFYMPGTAIPLKKSSRGRTQKFTYKKLQFVVATHNPYFIQTKRKLSKSAKGQVLVKGRVRQRRTSDRKITHYLFIDTMQKIGRRSKTKRKRKKS